MDMIQRNCLWAREEVPVTSSMKFIQPASKPPVIKARGGRTCF